MAIATQGRVSAGVREGGQYTTGARAEAEVALADPVPGQVQDVPGPTYQVPPDALEEAAGRVDKANRRLERAGIDERFTFEVSERKVRKNQYGELVFYHDVTLSHPKLNYDGWEFVATLDSTENGFITRGVPGKDLGGWRPESTACDHCGQERARSSTYVVRSEDGDLRQVGSTCIKNFLGVQPAGMWALGQDPLEFEEASRTWFPGGPTAAANEDVIAMALVVTDGGRRYVSSSQAQWDEVESTSSQVRHLLFGSHSPAQAQEVAGLREQADALVEDGTAAKILRFARNMEGHSDYATNMRTLAAGEHVDPRHTGILASAVSAYARKQGMREEAAKYQPGFMGQIKDKIAGHSATVTNVRYLEDNYNPRGGTRTLMVMRSDTGHELKWFATGEHDVDVGDELTFTGGTIKGHDNYRDRDQTVLTRVKYQAAE